MSTQTFPGQWIQRDVSWMIDTYPLHQDFIDGALHDFAAQTARADSSRAQVAADHPVCHRVTGPFEGFYIASYACPMGDLGTEFTGQYKICRREPESYWDAPNLIVAGCEGVQLTALAALVQAEALAMKRIVALRILDADLRARSPQHAGFGLAGA